MTIASIDFKAHMITCFIQNYAYVLKKPAARAWQRIRQALPVTSPQQNLSQRPTVIEIGISLPCQNY